MILRFDRSLCILRLVLAIGALLAWRASAAEAARAFDIPAGAAEKSLKQFATQSGLEVLFSTEAATGVRTNAVKGELVPSIAVKQLLDGTPLAVMPDTKNGVVRIARATDPNARRAAPNPSDRPAQSRSNTASDTGAVAAARSTSDTRRNDEEEPLTLSPFVISTDKDTGYIAADTLSAGRLSTNLLMTPGDIDVFTRDLLNDLGIFNIDEASGWLTNSRPMELGAIEGNSLNPSGLALDDSGSNVSLRGFGGQPSTRNYFASASTPKEHNVERIESSRGPNSILYGEGGAGGQVNYSTKQAQNRNFANVRLRTDTQGTFGAGIDLNRKLTSRLALRYNGNWLDQQYHISRTRFLTTGHAMSAVYRPFERTSVSVEADVTRTSRPGLIMTYLDQHTRWTGAPLPNTKLTAAQATAAGVLNRGVQSTNTWIDGIGMINLVGWGQTTGTAIPVPTTAAHPELFSNAITPPARDFNANPRQLDVVDHAADVQFAIDHTFRSKLSVQVAGQYGRYTSEGGQASFVSIYLDPLPFLPNAAGTALDPARPNPHFGKPYTATGLARNLDAWRESRSLRVVAAYPLRLLGGTTNVSAFAQRQEQDSRTTYSDPHIVDPSSTLPITDGSSLITVVRYLDNLPKNLPDFRSMYQIRDVPTAEGRSERTNDSVMVAASGRYLRDTLSIVGGFRRDKSDVTTQTGDVASRDRVTGQFGTYTVDPRVAYNNTVTIGLVYFPTRYVGAYVNHAEGFQVQSVAAPKLDGSYAHANIVPATDRSYGLRFHLARSRDVKVIGSLGYYKVEQTNSAFGVVVGGVNTLWRNHGMTDRYIETFHADPVALTNANSITTSRSFLGSGWEGSLTANVGNSFRLTLNGALPRTKQADVAADYVSYLNTHLPQWRQWAADPNNPTRANDSTLVTGIESTVASFQEGRSQNGTYKYRYNVFGVYTFQTAPIKGLRVGLGSQFFGQMIIGNEINRPFDYVYRASYHMVTGNIGYPFKFRNRRVDVQINVDNLLNYDTPLYNGLFVQATPTGGTVNIPYGFKYAWPRSARLTVTIPL